MIERIILTCGHRAYWACYELMEHDCALCDSTEFYHGTSATTAMSILRTRRMYDRTVAASKHGTALHYAMADEANPYSAIFTLDIEEARLRPVVTGHYESEKPVRLSAIRRIQIYKNNPDYTKTLMRTIEMSDLPTYVENPCCLTEF